jgi:hypothetical protein
MVEDRLTDGRRIAELLASEVEGDEDRLPGVSITDADRDVEPTVDGALAYAVVRGDGERVDDRDRASDPPDASRHRLAEVYVHPDRARVELLAGQAAGARVAEREGLPVRPKAVSPPRTLVFVEDGAAVKRAVPALSAALAASEDDEPTPLGDDADRDDPTTDATGGTGSGD